jgi:hypothetical protein
MALMFPRIGLQLNCARAASRCSTLGITSVSSDDNPPNVQMERGRRTRRLLNWSMAATEGFGPLLTISSWVTRKTNARARAIFRIRN